MSDAWVEIQQLRVRRGRRRVLDGCTTRLGPGVTVLVGGNGAGKSTLLGAVAGLVAADGGRVVVAGSPVRSTGLTRRQGDAVGYLPQDPRLPGRLTVADALDYARWLHRPAPSFTTAELAGRLGIDDILHQPLGELSGGMNRLAMIALVCVHRPPVLLLDEATAGVDFEHRATLRAFLDDLRSDTAVLLASHVAADVEHVADRVLALSGGSFAFDGPAIEFER